MPTVRARSPGGVVRGERAAHHVPAQVPLGAVQIELRVHRPEEGRGAERGHPAAGKGLPQAEAVRHEVLRLMDVRPAELGAVVAELPDAPPRPAPRGVGLVGAEERPKADPEVRRRGHPVQAPPRGVGGPVEQRGHAAPAVARRAVDLGHVVRAVQAHVVAHDHELREGPGVVGRAVAPLPERLGERGPDPHRPPEPREDVPPHGGEGRQGHDDGEHGHVRPPAVPPDQVLARAPELLLRGDGPAQVVDAAAGVEEGPARHRHPEHDVAVQEHHVLRGAAGLGGVGVGQQHDHGLEHVALPAEPV